MSGEKAKENIQKRTIFLKEQYRTKEFYLSAIYKLNDY
jgi:hypothetical protein